MLNPSFNLLRAFRITNLFCASVFVLGVIVPESWIYGSSNPGLPSRPHEPLAVLDMVIIGVIFVWFAAAIALFFRSRPAWFDCLPGLGLHLYLSVSFLVDILREIFFPNTEEVYHIAEGLVAARMLEMVTVAGFAIAWFVLSVGLIGVLTKCRKELR